MVDQRDEQQSRQHLWRSAGDGWSTAFEIALVPPIFAGVGLLLDRWIGIFPVLTIALLVFACIGMFAKQWLGYSARMQVEEAKVLGKAGR